MPNLEKLLKKFSSKERVELERIIEKIIRRDLRTLDVKKLKGFRDLFRVRRGNIRVIFKLTGKETHIFDIERRRESTYKF